MYDHPKILIQKNYTIPTHAAWYVCNHIMGSVYVHMCMYWYVCTLSVRVSVDVHAHMCKTKSRQPNWWVWCAGVISNVQVQKVSYTLTAWKEKQLPFYSMHKFLWLPENLESPKYFYPQTFIDKMCYKCMELMVISYIATDSKYIEKGLFVTFSVKTVPFGTFDISRNTTLKQWCHCSSLALCFSHARFTV